MSQLTSKEFWQDTADRTIRTMAQTALAACGTATMISQVDWKTVVGTTILSGLLCVLTCVATSADKQTISPASLVKNTTTVTPRHASKTDSKGE